MHDPGGKSFQPLPPGVTGAALFDGPDACYRLELRRVFSEEAAKLGTTAPFALWIGLNPSVADGDQDDPTIAIECAATRALGLDRYLKMNLSPYRATDPGRLRYAVHDLCPAGHVERLLWRAMTAARVVMACGVPPGPLTGYDDEVFRLLEWAGVELWCLGTTKEGFPRHPLYMGAAWPLARWYGRVEALGPTYRFFPPDAVTPRQTGDRWRVGDAWATPAHRPRRLRDLNYYQVVEVTDDGMPVTVPAGHLANRYADEVNDWAKRIAG